MFKKLTLKNFQKHKKLEVLFSPSVTTIVGATDAGKSAIIRALGLVCLNRWDPCFVQEGKGHVTVSLHTDQNRIVRQKGKGVNVYWINDKEFRAFASETPEEIAKAINVGDENFQGQLDPHFWFTETPGKVSKNLNRIVNLGIIDSSISNVATELRRARSEVEVSRTRLVEAKHRKEELEWVVEFEADLTALERLKKRFDLSASSRVSVAFLVENVERYSRAVSTLSEATLDADKLRTELSSAVKARTHAKALRGIVKELGSVELLSEIEVPDISDLQVERKEADEVAEGRRNLEMLIEEIQHEEDLLCTVEKEYATEASKFKTLSLQKLKEKKCPLCGAPRRKGKAKGAGEVVKSSRSYAPIFTCDTSPPLPEPKKTPGTKRRLDTSKNLVNFP